MAARNFLETDPNILYPRIDIAGERTGITGMEFPLLNYLCYLISIVFGYQHWYGRLIVLLVSSAGIYWFYKLVKKYTDPTVAFNAGIVLLFSIWYTYSRKIMPDTFSMSLMLFGLWHVLEYMDHKKAKHLALYSVFIMMGILSKLPSAFILGLLALPFFNAATLWKTRILIAVATFPALLTAGLWYFYWVPHLNQTYGFVHFFMGKGIMEGASELASHMNQTLSRFYDTPLKYIGFGFFTIGLYTALKQKHKLILSVFFIGFASFLPIMLKGGFTFYHHSYYIVPFVPVMALVCAYGIQALKKPVYMTIALVAIGSEGFFNHLDDFFMKEHNLAVLTLEPVLDSLSSRKDLIAISSGEYPTPMYFAHRRGWVAHKAQLQSRRYTDSLQEKGLKWIVVLKRTFGEDFMLQHYPQVFNNRDFRIYRLPEQPSAAPLDVTE